MTRQAEKIFPSLTAIEPYGSDSQLAQLNLRLQISAVYSGPPGFCNQARCRLSVTQTEWLNSYITFFFRTDLHFMIYALILEYGAFGTSFRYKLSDRSSVPGPYMGQFHYSV